MLEQKRFRARITVEGDYYGTVEVSGSWPTEKAAREAATRTGIKGDLYIESFTPDPDINKSMDTLLDIIERFDASEPGFNNSTNFADGSPGFIAYADSFINIDMPVGLAIIVDGSGIHILPHAPHIDDGCTLSWLPFNTNSPEEDGKPVLTKEQAMHMAKDVTLINLGEFLFNEVINGESPCPTAILKHVGFRRII